MSLVEIKDKEVWNSRVQNCLDYNLYQSYEWGELKIREGWRLKRFIVEGTSGFSLVQCLEKKIMQFNFVWIPGGPLLSSNSAITVLGDLLSGINEYYMGNGRLSYIRLNCQVRSFPELSIVFRDCGFQDPFFRIATNFTYIANEDYFKNIETQLSSNWRHNLKRSFKNEFKLSIKYNLDDIEKIFEIYNKMVDIKKIDKNRTLEQLRNLYYIMNGNIVTFVVHKESESVSARIILIYGNKAFDFLAATSSEGRKEYASYFLVYNMLKWCSENKISSFDFSGVEPFKAKGVYHFKRGTGAQLIEFAGEKEKASSSAIRIICNLMFYFNRVGG